MLFFGQTTLFTHNSPVAVSRTHGIGKNPHGREVCSPLIASSRSLNQRISGNFYRCFGRGLVALWRMKLVCCVLMTNVVIRLKGRAKAAPLHSALPANPRHWLGADSKAAHVGLRTSPTQVTSVHARPVRLQRFLIALPQHRAVSLLLSFSSIWTHQPNVSSHVLHAHLLFASLSSLNQPLPTILKAR